MNIDQTLTIEELTEQIKRFSDYLFGQKVEFSPEIAINPLFWKYKVIYQLLEMVDNNSLPEEKIFVFDGDKIEITSPWVKNKLEILDIKGKTENLYLHSDLLSRRIIAVSDKIPEKREVFSVYEHFYGAILDKNKEEIIEKIDEIIDEPVKKLDENGTPIKTKKVLIASEKEKKEEEIETFEREEMYYNSFTGKYCKSTFNPEYEQNTASEFLEEIPTTKNKILYEGYKWFQEKIMSKIRK